MTSRNPGKSAASPLAGNVRNPHSPTVQPSLIPTVMQITRWCAANDPALHSSRLGSLPYSVRRPSCLSGPARSDHLCVKVPDTGAEEAMNAWFVVMIILLGIVALTLDRYDVWLWRVLTWIALGWFVLGALLLGYRGEHL